MPPFPPKNKQCSTCSPAFCWECNGSEALACCSAPETAQTVFGALREDMATALGSLGGPAGPSAGLPEGGGPAVRSLERPSHSLRVADSLELLRWAVLVGCYAGAGVGGGRAGAGAGVLGLWGSRAAAEAQALLLRSRSCAAVGSPSPDWLLVGV